MRVGGLVVLALLHAALVVGGVALLLTSFGDELDRELDREVRSVEQRLDREFDRLDRELERRLPAVPAVPAP